jgi:hypothetical protein
MKAMLGVVAGLLGALSFPTGANAIKEFVVSETLNMADTVIVGTLDTSASGENPASPTVPRVQIRVESVIKGRPPATIVLDKGFDITEQSITCCEKNVRYLMFLIHGEGIYLSVNGRYGIYKLED